MPEGVDVIRIDWQGAVYRITQNHNGILWVRREAPEGPEYQMMPLDYGVPCLGGVWMLELLQEAVKQYEGTVALNLGQW